jgi:hypothetical protein
MSDRPQVVISGFGDEAANHKAAIEQFAAMSALGLQYYSLRFIDVGSGIKNVMKLTKTTAQKTNSGHSIATSIKRWAARASWPMLLKRS